MPVVLDNDPILVFWSARDPKLAEDPAAAGLDNDPGPVSALEVGSTSE